MTPVYAHKCLAKEKLNLTSGDLVKVKQFQRFYTKSYFSDLYSMFNSDSQSVDSGSTIVFLDAEDCFMIGVGVLLLSKWLVQDRVFFACFENDYSEVLEKL